jgi:hypothetical protein
VKPPIESASIEPNPKVGWAFEQIQSCLEVPPEEAGGHNRGGHPLRIGGFALEAFLMAAGKEPIVGKAVNSYDNGVHEAGNPKERN